jgi:hypothetical protein
VHKSKGIFNKDVIVLDVKCSTVTEMVINEFIKKCNAMRSVFIFASIWEGQHEILYHYPGRIAINTKRDWRWIIDFIP